MYVDFNTIILIGSLITAISLIAGLFYKLVAWISEQKLQTKKIHEIQEEQAVISYVLLAVLTGLKQLGANGEVTKAHDEFEKHLNKKAHEQV